MKRLVILLAVFAGLTAYAATSTMAADHHQLGSSARHGGSAGAYHHGAGAAHGGMNPGYGHGNYGHRPSYVPHGYTATHGHGHVPTPHIDVRIGH